MVGNTTAIGEINLGSWWLVSTGRGQGLDNTLPKNRIKQQAGLS